MTQGDAAAPAEPPREGRLVGLDWGERRIGVAVSDELQTVARPLATLTRRDGKRFPMQQLRVHLAALTPVGIVVGLPLDGAGREGPSARAARAAGALVAQKSGLPVAYIDERMSTARAHAIRREVGAGAPKDRGEIDQAAAAILLQ
ncbi:MAG TPA: Holliday junction resolvase RuvX, partial [Gemmatimonadales bacterium]